MNVNFAIVWVKDYKRLKSMIVLHFEFLTIFNKTNCVSGWWDYIAKFLYVLELFVYCNINQQYELGAVYLIRVIIYQAYVVCQRKNRPIASNASFLENNFVGESIPKQYAKGSELCGEVIEIIDNLLKL